MNFKEFADKKLLNEGARHNLSDKSIIEFTLNKEVSIDDAIACVSNFLDDLNAWKENGWETVVAHNSKEIIPMKEYPEERPQTPIRGPGSQSFKMANLQKAQHAAGHLN